MPKLRGSQAVEFSVLSLRVGQLSVADPTLTGRKLREGSPYLSAGAAKDSGNPNRGSAVALRSRAGCVQDLLCAGGNFVSA